MNRLLGLFDFLFFLLFAQALLFGSLLALDPLLFFELSPCIVSLLLAKSVLFLAGDTLFFQLQLLLLLFQDLTFTLVSIELFLPLLLLDQSSFLLKLRFTFDFRLLCRQLLLHLLKITLLLQICSV